MYRIPQNLFRWQKKINNDLFTYSTPLYCEVRSAGAKEHASIAPSHYNSALTNNEIWTFRNIRILEQFCLVGQKKRAVRFIPSPPRPLSVANPPIADRQHQTPEVMELLLENDWKRPKTALKTKCLSDYDDSSKHKNKSL